jgi:acetyl-CoA carboxylase biotin carboxyl carrier protein
MAKIKCEMTGTLIEYLVKVGAAVNSGDEVATLESMKMEVPVVSSVAGKVTALLKSAGDFVNEGDAIIELA